MPGGIQHIIKIGKSDNKFSLGSFNLDFTSSTFWVILSMVFLSSTNFGIDQTYVQRYHATTSQKAAANHCGYA